MTDSEVRGREKVRALLCSRTCSYTFLPLRGLMMFRLTMAPQSAPGCTPPLGSAPWPLTPAGPRLPSGGGPCCLGCPLIRAPQVVGVAAGYLPPPGGRAAGWVCTGLHAIRGLEMFENVIKRNSCSQSELAAVESPSLLNRPAWYWPCRKHKHWRSAHLSRSLKRVKVGI